MSFPYYSQLDSMDCGPSCLRMIAKYYGKTYTLQTLRERCFITREGVSMLGISDAAETIGFRTIGVRITFEQLSQETALPCILHWNQNHFVVCYRIKLHRNNKATIYIADPASKKLTYDKDDFLKCWISKRANGKDTGIALMLQPTPTFSISDEECSSARHDLLFFVRYLLPYKKEFGQLILGMMVGSGLQLMAPLLTQAVVDKGIEGRNLNFIFLVLIAQLVIFFSQLSLQFVRSWLMLHVNTRIDISLISDFLAKLMRLPLRFFDTKNTGDIMQRIGDHGRIKDFLMGDSINILFSAFNFVVFGIILAYFNVVILGISLLGNLLYVAWISIFMKYRRILDIRRFNQSAGEQNKLIQLIQGMQEVKLNNCEKQKRWEWERIQVKLYKIGLKGLAVGQIQEVGSTFFTQGTNIIISFIAAKSVVEGQMTLGMMMSLTYIIGQVTAPISQLVSFIRNYQDAKISLERLNEIHHRRDEDFGVTSKLKVLPNVRDITIESVYFSYSGANRDFALEGVSLKIPARQVTAIVGASGSGKTTLVKLIQGFYAPNSGVVKIGNTPLAMINPHVWRASTGSVMQESYIFSDTIAKNIAISTDEIDADRLRNAVRVANIQNFIYSLPMGYDTKIGMEGSGISQGQRQRLLIARAVYKNPEYIFLDEATNSLDANNEKIIMENLHEFYRGKTVLIVAHRLSTVKDADNIIVLDKGKVVEQGTHEQLSKKKGAYYTLVKNQLELGK